MSIRWNTAILTVVTFTNLYSLGSLAGNSESCRRLYSEIPVAHVSELQGVSNSYDPWILEKQLPNGEREINPANGKILSLLMDSSLRRSKPLLATYLAFPGLSFFLPSMVFHQEGLDRIYRGYGSSISPQIIAAVKETEIMISVARTSTFSVTPRYWPDNVLGFFRVFDGTDYGGLNDGSIHKFDSLMTMPLEYMLRHEGIERVPILENDRRELFSVFEMGKYFIDPDVPADVKMALKKMIYTWLEKMILQPHDPNDPRITIDPATYVEHTYIYAHVATETHRKAFYREFGLVAVTDPKLNGGLKPPQYILRASFLDFRNKVRDYLLKNGAN